MQSKGVYLTTTSAQTWLLSFYSALITGQCLIVSMDHACADQVKEGREGSDEDADEVTGGVRRGSGDKKRKGDVCAWLIAVQLQPWPERRRSVHCLAWKESCY